MVRYIYVTLPFRLNSYTFRRKASAHNTEYGVGIEFLATVKELANIRAHNASEPATLLPSAVLPFVCARYVIYDVIKMKYDQILYIHRKMP